ncbi:hypothetical protein MRS44_003662 [Fusarium solani]|uniref:uncharacterized protein n=1 Tax=Fusarium solani TaxID=169388 RepID=UPI0032C3EC07|nr:hypothetical protein MRS44_003662 [Fusarium solani]
MKLLAFLLSTAAVTLAAPALEARQFEDIIFPAGTYRRWVQSGKIVQDPQDQLLIVKNGKAADETTTIVTFNFDQSTEGKTCELIFELWDRDVSTGTQTLDVFTWSDPQAVFEHSPLPILLNGQKPRAETTMSAVSWSRSQGMLPGSWPTRDGQRSLVRLDSSLVLNKHILSLNGNAYGFLVGPPSYTP